MSIDFENGFLCDLATKGAGGGSSGGAGDYGQYFIVGTLTLPIPEIKWTRQYPADFGYTASSGAGLTPYSNGKAHVMLYSAKTPKTASWNALTQQWETNAVSWWNNGPPEMLYSGGGVFLAKIVGFGNIITSFDGITWNNGGYCTGGKNALTCGAYDASRGLGIVGWWYYLTPLYYSYDDLTQRTEWTKTTSAPVLKYVTSYNGKFVGVESGDKVIKVATDPSSWTQIVAEQPNTRYMFLTEVNNKLFVMKYTYVTSPSIIYTVSLCLLDISGNLTETNLTHVGNLDNNNIPNPLNICWVPEWNKFVLFKHKMMCMSDDGITWDETPQDALVDSNGTFNGSIYIPDKGFYVNSYNQSGSGSVLFGSLELF